MAVSDTHAVEGHMVGVPRIDAVGVMSTEPKFAPSKVTDSVEETG